MATFVVVELPRLATPGTDYSRRHPGLTVDFLLHHEPPRTLRLFFRAVGREDDLEGLLDALRSSYPSLRPIGDPEPRARAGTLEMHDLPHDEVAAAVAAFTRRQAVEFEWGRIEEGVVFSRLLVPAAEAQGMAQRLRGDLLAAGLDANVSVESQDDRELAPWLELLRGIRGWHPQR